MKIVKTRKNRRTISAARRLGPPQGAQARFPGKEPSEIKQIYQCKGHSRAIAIAQKLAKEGGKQKWLDAEGRPEPYPQPTKPQFDRSETVRRSLREAAQEMKNTINITANGKTYTVGRFQAAGKEVRRAVLNSILYTPVAVGNIREQHPKRFLNLPYKTGPLLGQQPIDNVAIGVSLGEYPVTKQKCGRFGGSGAVGPARLITSRPGQGGCYAIEFHDDVVGHDPTRGGSNEDHFLATVS